MFCPNCGIEVAEGANFCPKCGVKMGPSPTPAGTPGQPPRTEVKPAPAISKLDEGGLARVVLSLGMLGLLFIAFTRFSSPFPTLSLGSLISRTIGYGTAMPVLGILFGGGMISVGFVFRERIKGLIADTEILLIGGGVAVAAILMTIPSPRMGENGWFIFELLIGVVLVQVGLTLLRTTARFTDHKLEVLCGRVVAISLLVFAGFTVVTGVGILVRSVTLSVDLPNDLMIISSITGLLGVLVFAGATVMRLLGLEPGR